MAKKTKTRIGGEHVVAGIHVMPYSTAIRAGDFLFISGQIPADEKGQMVSGGIEAQTRQVMENLRRVLAEAGCTFDDAVKTTVFLADVRDFWSFNKVYGEYFKGGVAPARSTVRADLVLDAKVEIELVAYKPQ